MEGIEVGCGLADRVAASGAGEWGPTQTIKPCGEGKDATWCQYTVTQEGSGWVPYQFAWAGYSLAAYTQLYNQVQTIRALLNQAYAQLGEEVGMEQSGTMAMYASLNWSHLLGTERVVASCQSTGANPIFGTCSFTCESWKSRVPHR
jgi:hypothetical protein